ncbi:50S ribosomal protein L18 [Candidatus Kaiserbacteria bacterium RIFCSPHIGHO2_02_FULL_50_50]|uniref:Large ribosomal subunit protein uL18 n=1 Tax=Candidatus Kaiserbacteria bacterium RIFCSPHIGHO2_02_FULL_50_50 TaxID=1798492 RepID=A0A1F6DDQ0_9BACT|nr:MAG: 50S ribosomal protein L18 [Candidatus Kaiserbacteria bacterium RIFCSPHIGHO2_02_FULL_50_50]OGG88743.1 MAG: 50S ribosomal protein L18 [Candidatus Kaiserbacteria bacterium RIFCSPLOWO2_12_FULL_50_10]
MSTAKKILTRAQRHKRIRARVEGTAARPRLAVFRSNKALYAQVIDDVAGKTLAAIDTRKLAGAKPTERAASAGTAIAEKVKALGLDTIVFDRGGFAYAGSIAALADAARAAGLKF